MSKLQQEQYEVEARRYSKMLDEILRFSMIARDGSKASASLEDKIRMRRAQKALIEARLMILSATFDILDSAQAVGYREPTPGDKGE